MSKCPGLRIGFTSDDVSNVAEELCKNWMLKILSIRGLIISVWYSLSVANSTDILSYIELVPRIYLELAFLKCTRFSIDADPTSSLERLTEQIRGIADPLVAAYARAYLVKIAQQGTSVYYKKQ